MKHRNRRKQLSTSARFRILERDGFACRYCGRRAPEVVLNVDHVHAVANGGSNDPGNLVTSCAACNLGKSDRPVQFPEQQQPREPRVVDTSRPCPALFAADVDRLGKWGVHVAYVKHLLRWKFGPNGWCFYEDSPYEDAEAERLLLDVLHRNETDYRLVLHLARSAYTWLTWRAWMHGLLVCSADEGRAI